MLNKAAILPGKISIEVVKESEENPVLWDLNRFSNKDPRSSLYGVHSNIVERGDILFRFIFKFICVQNIVQHAASL